MMRLVWVVAIVLSADVAHADGSSAVLTAQAADYNFGTVTASQPHVHTYNFTNSGNEPLVITNVSSTCGCLVPEWPKAPVAPGKYVTIKSTFTSSAPGKFSKSMTVTYNGRPVVLTLRGDVQPPSPKKP